MLGYIQGCGSWGYILHWGLEQELGWQEGYTIYSSGISHPLSLSSHSLAAFFSFSSLSYTCAVSQYWIFLHRRLQEVQELMALTGTVSLQQSQCLLAFLSPLLHQWSLSPSHTDYFSGHLDHAEPGLCFQISWVCIWWVCSKWWSPHRGHQVQRCGWIWMQSSPQDHL